MPLTATLTEVVVQYEIRDVVGDETNKKHRDRAIELARIDKSERPKPKIVNFRAVVEQSQNASSKLNAPHTKNENENFFCQPASIPKPPKFTVFMR